MPTLTENLQVWNGWYDWPGEGDEWSAQFGDTESLWWFVLYPRIHRFLPAQTILEIAPGYGRWTQFLKAHCQSMFAVDISDKCIEHCKLRFGSDNHIKFHVNDGTSLAAVPDDSIDFAFSFDSLVHVEKDVIEGYLVQLARKLTPNGVGFFHHSNIGAYPKRLAMVEFYRRHPYVFRRRLLRRLLTEERVEAILSINASAWRATSMSGELFRQFCEAAGLKCVSQELIGWTKGRCLIDGISVFARPQSKWTVKKVPLGNDGFLQSARDASRLAQLYCG
jgi:ubiquinone/menaquinone biosynthesis C-methylase UbiE